MTEFEKIKTMNKIMINTLKDNGKDFKKHQLIADILEDEECFLKMTKEEAFLIFENLNIKDEYKEIIYTELISSK